MSGPCDTSALRAALDGLVRKSGELGDAWFSPDDAHRYLLLRGDLDGDGPLITFVMLNPSTADHDQDDPTITRCRKYAARYAIERGLIDAIGGGLGGARVAIANLYAIRATDPDVAFAHPRKVGGEVNNRVILELARASDLVIAAWGADRRSHGRAAEVRRALAGAGVTLHRIGPPAKGGHPKHPLYLRGDLALESAS